MVDEEQLEAVRRLLMIAERYRLAALEVEEAGLRVSIRGEDRRPSPAAAAPIVEPAPAAVPELTASHPHPEHVHVIRSPMMGTFYRAPAPDAPPYAEEGMQLEEGQAIGVLEAMKVFSDVPTDRAGTLREFRARNGDLVQPGDPLVLIELAA